MTTNTQVRDPAAIEVILDDANLDAVSGGEKVIDGVTRAILGFQLNSAVLGYLGGEAIREGGPCPLGYK
jgi:hypothetical protein